MPDPPEGVCLNLDDAWTPPAGIRTLDLRHWGPRLRYHGKRKEVDAFFAEIRPQLAPFVLYGSGDFHYLAGALLREVAARQTPTQPSPGIPEEGKQSTPKLPQTPTGTVTVVSFDNHPDWDVRPPYWACGGWINRALELPNVRGASVWGCGNFELAFPSRLFANRRALRSGRLQVHAWAERQPPAVRRRFDCMTRENWRERFERFAESLAGKDVYVTVDLDCLRDDQAVTNWEQGLFTAEDVAWAIGRLRERGRIIAGDLCGAYSPPGYARHFQRFAANWDHPRLPPVDPGDAARINTAALNVIWPVLCGPCNF